MLTVKRAMLILLSLCLLALGGAALAAETDVFTFLGPEYCAFRDSFDRDFPVAVGYRMDGVAGGAESYRWDRASIEQVFQSLCAVTVGNKDDRMATDSDSYYFFLMADGRKICFSFNQGYIMKDGVRYAIAGDLPSSAIFPCYGGYFTLFDVCMDEKVSDFAANFDTVTPVSVSFSQGGGTPSVVTDADFIRSVKEAMDCTEAVWVDDAEYYDPAGDVKSEFVFTMPDGNSIPFTLCGDRIAVDPKIAQLGVQYYSLEGTDALWQLSFPGYERIRIDKGIANDLLPLYGKDVNKAFSAENREQITNVTVTRTKGSETLEELTFTNEPYDAASDLARAFAELGYLEALDGAPADDGECTFVFADAQGKAYAFRFVGDCAAIEDADGHTYYFPVRHGDIDENGVMDLAYAERDLLAWKNEVNFQGKAEKKPNTATILGVVLAVLTIAAGVALTIVKQRKKNGAGDK